jgi:DNA-binding MarR family transcriptional regulator
MAVTSARTPPPTEGLSPAELAAWHGFLRAHALLVRELDCDLEAAHGLPLVSYELLVRLERAPDQRMRMRDLADAVMLSRSGLTRLVDRLVRDGLIRRSTCSADARGAYAVLEPKGLRALQAARPTHLEGIRRCFLDHFDEAELARLSGLWERLASAQEPTEGCA